MLVRITLLLLLLCTTQLHAFDKADQDHVLWVTQAQVDEFLIAMARDNRAPRNDGYTQELLGEIREHTLLAKAYESLGVPLDESAMERLAQSHEEIARRVLTERRLQVQEVSDDELMDLAELSRYVYYVSHILVSYKGQADELYQQLQRGSSFSLLAKRHSKDPGSAEAGGTLGAVRVGNTVAQFEQTVLHMHEGELSEPVQSPFGWHIIRLDSLVLYENPPDEKGLLSLRRHLQKQRRQLAEQRVIHDVRLSNGFQVNEDVLRSGLHDANAVAGSTRDTSITVRQLKASVEEAFGDRVDDLNEDIYLDFLKYWLDQQVWRQECLRERIYRDDEVLDRIDIHERLIKSGLLVAQELEPRVEFDDQDMWNYLTAHPGQFMQFRHFGVWRLDFADSLQAEEARSQILREDLGPAEAIARWQPGENPYELTPEEARAMGASTYSDLVDLDPGRWSPVSKDGKDMYHLWFLVGRRQPMMEESEILTEAVRKAVHDQMLAAEITRVVDELSALIGWTEARLVLE